MLSERVYGGRRQKLTEQELKKILEAWQEISLTEIRASIYTCSWRKRLKLVIEQDGGHIEHCLGESTSS